MEIDKFVAKVLLDNPDKKNALDDLLIKELIFVLDQLDRNSSVRVVLLGSANETFCSGGDIKAMIQKTDMFKGTSIDLRKQYHEGIQEISRSIERFRKPIIAVVNGPAVGAGADLACMCDLRIGSEKFMFKETFANLALVPGDGGTFFLSRVVGYAKAMELYLTGRSVNPDEAKNLGILNYLVPSETIWNSALSLGVDIASKPPVAIEMTKQAMKEAHSNSNLESNLNLLSALQSITQLTQDHTKGLGNLKGGSEKYEGS